MKSIFRLLCFFFLLCSFYNAHAAAGDTVKVQAFTYGSRQDSTFLFPPDTFNCSKVLMYYKLKCPTGGCGEWDYLTYTYLFQPTGKIDSYLVNQPFFTASGQVYDSLPAMKSASWAYTFNATTKAVDSVINNPIQLVFYRNTTKPWLPTDTSRVWAAYFRISYDSVAKKADTTWVKADMVYHQKYTSYYYKYPDNLRYELARYITPYGVGLNLGNGFTWVYDVSDYRHLLHDSVHLAAGNWQEWLDLSFAFIKGTPPRDIKSIRNLWNGNPAYGTSTSIETFLHPLTVKLDPNASSWRIKMRTTGHGFGGTDNCAEFCPRLHNIDVDGKTRFADTMFRYDCSLNPVAAQGGTWLYSRSNWCPGSYVKTYDYELTPYVKAGDSVTLDYNIQPYKWNGVGTTPYYAIETQLVSYGPPNFHLNAAVEDIIRPTNKDIYRRMNPVCSEPVILIRNNGADTLTSLDISYGVQGSTPFIYHWTGSLAFLDTARVILSGMNWSGASNNFKVSLSNPNNKTDEYPADDVMSSYFSLPPSMPAKFYIELLTNAAASEDSYTLKDAYGNIIKNKSNFKNNTYYKDTVNLPAGCYTLQFNDAGGDGLSWWANAAAGAGSLDLRSTNHKVIKNFNPDFGSEIYYQFTIGSYADGIAPEAGIEPFIQVYPNPNEGRFTLSLSLPDKENITVGVMDAFGREVYSVHREVTTAQVDIDLGTVAKGWYIVKISTKEGSYFRKILVR